MSPGLMIATRGFVILFVTPLMIPLFVVPTYGLVILSEAKLALSLSKGISLAAC
jgi:hypothetical protein